MFAGGADRQWAQAERDTRQQLRALGVDASAKIFAGEGHVPRSLTSQRLLQVLNGLRR